MLFKFLLITISFFKNFIKRQLILAVYLLPLETFVDMVTHKQMYCSLSKTYSDKATAQKNTSSMRAVSYLLAHGDKSCTVANTRTCSIKCYRVNQSQVFEEAGSMRSSLPTGLQ